MDPDTRAARQLLAQVIDSFEKLEIVMYLHRAAIVPQPAAIIAKAISLPVDEVERCLAALEHAGVLDPKGPWAGAVADLVKMYEDDRIEVLNLMTRNSFDRVRAEAARVFADAFLLRPKKKGDPDA